MLNKKAPFARQKTSFSQATKFQYGTTLNNKVLTQDLLNCNVILTKLDYNNL